MLVSDPEAPAGGRRRSSGHPVPAQRARAFSASGFRGSVPRPPLLPPHTPPRPKHAPQHNASHHHAPPTAPQAASRPHALLTLSLPIRGGSHRDSAAPRDCCPCGGIGAGSHVLTVGVGGPVHAGHSDPSTGAIPKFTDSPGEQRHTPDSRT